MDYITLDEIITENELDFVSTVADSFFIPATEYRDIKTFIMINPLDVRERRKVIYIDNKKHPELKDIKLIHNENLKGISRSCILQAQILIF